MRIPATWFRPLLLLMPALLAVGLVLHRSDASPTAAGPTERSDAAAAAGSPSFKLGDVDFPHELHFDALEIECEQCHHETKATLLDIPHQDYFDDFWIKCAICHRETPSESAPLACSHCHHASPRDIADETLSAKVVIHRSCWQCHEVGTGGQASQSCASCHAGGLRSTPAVDAAGKEGSR